ncbi:hypothetical protein SAMN05421641_101217 [Paracoccus thiocyanatus]|uniref:Uncharacterized protein n=1 Tax=Paracoccus thiocyanatus TaxID=34006 RepID=A0A1N6NAC5_9RHOB|nr:hypothetical protein [Paracoccus thiocyanatus]SIP88977.1 hypothetical protein SAMN05421641_101217 [Paracoccus thiocyanatus]
MPKRQHRRFPHAAAVALFTAIAMVPAAGIAAPKTSLVLAIGGEPETGFDPLMGWGAYGHPLFQSTLLRRDADQRSSAPANPAQNASATKMSTLASMAFPPFGCNTLFWHGVAPPPLKSVKTASGIAPYSRVRKTMPGRNQSKRR